MSEQNEKYIPNILSFDLSTQDVGKIKKEFNIINYEITENYEIDNRYGVNIVSSVFFPSNFHEFEIMIFDLDYKRLPSKKLTRSMVPENTGKYTVIRTPDEATSADLKPYNLYKVGQNDTKKDVIKIFFCGRYYNEDYNFRNIGSDYSIYKNYSNYVLTKITPEDKCGKRIKLTNNDDIFSSILKKYIKDFKYECILHRNTYYKDKFYSLLQNEEDEVVSYCYNDGEGCFEFYFPEIDDKASFLLDLFNLVLPKLKPEFFPFSTKFLWRQKEKYLLPGSKEILNNISEIKKELDEKIKNEEKKLKENNDKYKYLIDMLTETGDNLVSAVTKSLRFLGFDAKEEKEFLEPGALKEEDIRIDEEDKQIIMECKGIAGTSTDDDCRQIQKIKNRRQRKRNKFDVFGVYIVNHQMFLEPDKRINPPFQDTQIDDASEEVGLTTTYDLYKQIKAINKNYATKEKTKEAFLRTGYINFELDNLVYLGEVKEVLKKGKVAIFNLNEEIIEKNMRVIFLKNDEYFESDIISIKVNDKDVDKASSVEVGILVEDIELKNKMKIYKFK